MLAQRPDAPVVGAGVVVPGLVDREAGIATYSANLGWRHLELVRSLGAEWRLPVRIANDVASGGVAEHRLGAGAGSEDRVFVPIGTGIVASIVSGGHLVTGHRGETADPLVEALADGLAIVSLLVGPALVVMSGGLSRAGEGLLDPVALRQRTAAVHPADVTASALGDRGGVIGAALLARDGWAPES